MCTALDVNSAVSDIDELLTDRKRWLLVAAMMQNRPVLSIDELSEEAGLHPVDPDHNPEENMRDQERLSMLTGALGELSGDDQLLIQLRFDDDYSASQIARMMHFDSPKQVYTRIGTVLLRLRRLMESREDVR